MIRVENLVKRYGRTTAVDDVSFRVDKGEVTGFLGPNGAGKSTTLRMIAGYVDMTAGRVVLAGHDLEDDPVAARANLGYMPETAPLYPEMRVAEYLGFRAELKGVPRSKRKAYVFEAMEKTRVVDRANTPIGALSKGYRQRVSLADALVARPKVLVLDEPTAGLDPNQIVLVREVIRALGREHTVLLSTHILGEVEAVCGRVLVLAKGRLVAKGTLAELRAMRAPAAILVDVSGDPEAAREAVRALSFVGEVALEASPVAGADAARDATGRAVTAVTTLACTWSNEALASLASAEARDPHVFTERVVAALVARGLGVRGVRAPSTSLEEVFVELTREAGPGALA